VRTCLTLSWPGQGPAMTWRRRATSQILRPLISVRGPGDDDGSNPSGGSRHRISRSTRSREYYQSVLDTTDHPEIIVLAEELATEESEHVAELQKWIAAHKPGRAWPSGQ